MRVFYDCEFLEDGRTIDLISIGMVAEEAPDGDFPRSREYYAVNRDIPVRRIRKHDWLMRNVVPLLPRLHGDRRLQAGRRNPLALDWDHPDVRPREVIADEVRDFLLAVPDRELYAWYGAYDHVALCQLWGSMVDLPKGVPMWTNDLKQECVRLGDPRVPEQTGTAHNALADARHAWDIARFLDRLRGDLR